MNELWQQTGVLNWSRDERVTDRYGAVKLFAAVQDDEEVSLSGVPVGVKARLVAEVVEARQSSHIGDLFRGFVPPDGGPAVGERVELGEGVVFLEGSSLGLAPDDGRDTDWLDPEALYRVHEQTVRLVLIESVVD